LPEGKFKVGQDVASVLGITKYEAPKASYQQGLGGKKRTKKKCNPYFDKYTDIDNIKNYPKVFEEGDEVIITEKTHGTNFRAGYLPRYKRNLFGKLLSLIFGGYEFVYGSHNVQLQNKLKKKIFYDKNVYAKIAKKYKLDEIIPKNYIIYGEIYGQGIQDLEYGKQDIDVVFFDLKYQGKYISWKNFQEFCMERCLPTVPILYEGEYNQEILNTCTGGSSFLYPFDIREGCVVKSLIESNHPRLGRKILKSINEEYLLRKGRTEYK